MAKYIYITRGQVYPLIWDPALFKGPLSDGTICFWLTYTYIYIYGSFFSDHIDQPVLLQILGNLGCGGRMYLLAGDILLELIISTPASVNHIYVYVSIL